MAVPPRSRRPPQTNDQQHQRFSWQTPPVTPPEQERQAHQLPQQYAQQQQQPAPINSDLDSQRNRTFSYAQTPSEHLAFQYIPSPNEPPLPRAVTPIDPRPQPIYNPQSNPAQPQAHPTYQSPSHLHQEQQPLSPLSPHDTTNPALSSPVSPIPEPQRIHTQPEGPQQSEHSRQLSNLLPINTNVASYYRPPVPATPHSHHTQASPLLQKPPITPISPNSCKKDPADYPLPMSPKSTKSYAHEAYSPHNFSSSNIGHPVFSPNSPHGPNGLDFALHRPGQIAHPNMDLSAEGSTREWKHALCSCSGDISTCLTGLVCPCVLYGRTSYRLTQKSNKQDPTDLLSYNATNGHCMLMALSCGFWWLFPMIQRTRLRHMYKLEGGVGGDCVRAACCCCCVAVQNEREVREREESNRRLAGPASTEVYSSRPQMAYKRQQ